jgi:hypothetical protein
MLIIYLIISHCIWYCVTKYVAKEWLISTRIVQQYWNPCHTILLELQCDYKIGIILKIYENLTSIEDYIWIDMN